MNEQERQKTLETHRLWMHDLGGARANLDGAYLLRASFSGDDFSRAGLNGSNLNEADLSEEVVK